MKIVVLAEAQQDIKWWRFYYRRVFPEGKNKASKHFDRCIRLLSENPYAGKAIEGTRLRQFPILRTPFILVYRIDSDELKIARVWDTRQEPSPGFQEEQTKIK